MKTTMPYKRTENILYAVISLFVGWRITFYHTSALPDFDIAANNIYTTIECEVLTFVLWGMLIFLFRFIGKQVDDIRKKRLFKITSVLVYWLIVWGFCHYQCAIKAVQDWNDMMNGNMG
ncbi:hypothetical protein [Bacteroides gallinarum]|uniref:hypothetical protein n=2 Tax=Bacteroides gallinarum TaxID=376806 RepID=UPI000FE14222|nr:hypothetical protein [Bacteroides gallinarum]